MKMDKGIRKLRSKRGLISQVARSVGVSRQAVYQWTTVPLDHVIAVSELTGIPPHELRPDAYPQWLFAKWRL